MPTVGINGSAHDNFSRLRTSACRQLAVHDQYRGAQGNLILEEVDLRTASYECGGRGCRYGATWARVCTLFRRYFSRYALFGNWCREFVIFFGWCREAQVRVCKKAEGRYQRVIAGDV